MTTPSFPAVAAVVHEEPDPSDFLMEAVVAFDSVLEAARGAEQLVQLAPGDPSIPTIVTDTGSMLSQAHEAASDAQAFMVGLGVDAEMVAASAALDDATEAWSLLDLDADPSNLAEVAGATLEHLAEASGQLSAALDPFGV